MKAIRVPLWHELEAAVPTLVLSAELGSDMRPHLVALWSLAVAKGAGPYHPLVVGRACGWNGDARRLVDALVYAGWVDEAEDGVAIRPWEDVLGYVEPEVAVGETKEERRKRQQRERARRFRAKNRSLDE